MSTGTQEAVRLLLTRAELAVVAAVVGDGADGASAASLGLPESISEDLGAYSMASLVARGFVQVNGDGFEMADELAAVGLCVAAPDAVVCIGIADDEAQVVRILASGSLRVALEPRAPLLLEASLLTDEVPLQVLIGGLVAAGAEANPESVLALSVERWQGSPCDVMATCGQTVDRSVTFQSGEAQELVSVSAVSDRVIRLLETCSPG